jgi:hypothetical protein
MFYDNKTIVHEIYHFITLNIITYLGFTLFCTTNDDQLFFSLFYVFMYGSNGPSLFMPISNVI